MTDSKLAKVPVYQTCLFSDTVTETHGQQDAEPQLDSWRPEEDIVIWRIEVHYLRRSSNSSDRRWHEWHGFGFTGINQHPRDMGTQLEQIFALIEHQVTSNVTSNQIVDNMLQPAGGVWEFNKGYPVDAGDTIYWSMYWENDSSGDLTFDGYAVIYYSRKRDIK